MIKEFIPYELALELKQLGFDEPCFAYYTVVPEDNINWFTISEQAVTDNGSIFGSSKNYNTEWFETEGTISAPTYAQAFRFFREKYGLYINLIYDWNDEMYRVTIMVQNEDKSCKVIYLKEGDYIKEYKTLEEAELACLKKLIEIVKGGNK
jgi:hypothetical protein